MNFLLPDGGISPICFGYSSPLKTLYKQGKFQGLKSFSGEELKHPSLDHIVPKSLGGKNELGNYVLTNCKENHARGAENIDYYLEKNLAGVMAYIRWFESHVIEGFDCKGYATKIINTINKASKKFLIINEKASIWSNG